MSWLFSRRNDEDSDEWTDASDSEDEYTDASESDEELKETTIIENGDDETIDKNGKEIFTDDLSKNDPSEPNEPAAAAAAAANAAANAENPPPPPSTTTTVVDTEKNPAEKNIDNSAAEIVASSDDTAVVTSERNTESTDEIQEISPLTTDNDAGESTDDNRTSSLVDESGEQTSEKKLLELDQQSQLEFRESEKNGPEVEQHDSESQKGQQDAGDAGTETPSENEKEQRTAATGNEEETTNAEVEKEEEKEEDEEVTSMHEKRSLLLLAAEHDRVDILNAILADDSESRVMLLNSGIPPLHISIAFGSTNAVQSLLRMGADPSIRPDVNAIKNEFEAQGEEQLVDIPNMGRFDNLTAWELAFGKANAEKTNPKKSGWFGGGVKRGLDIAPSKLETIRMGFTAEALRSIGSDEVDRLKQLLDSGMPATIDIGGKNLYDWSVEMGALQCEELLRPEEAARSESFAAPAGDATSEQQANVQDGTRKEAASAVLDRSKPGEESLSSLVNRIDELESLSKALSSCLDNLAEEVSVCHGLLLMGGGASALASHVRSLKTLKENKIVELQHLEEAWEFSEDELAYWVKESGEQGREVAELMSPAIIPKVNEETTPKRTVEEEQAHKQQLKANAALLENKIRKLRASITDLSEENTRDLAEVESRGLSGGIKLVRGLRDELRDIEHNLNETKSAEALCRAKIKLIQAKIGTKKPASSSVVAGGENAITGATIVIGNETEEKNASQPQASAQTSSDTTATQPIETKAVLASEAIATGNSTAITVKNKKPEGYLTVNLWRILLRIIGLGSSVAQPNDSNNSGSDVMLV